MARVTPRFRATASLAGGSLLVLVMTLVWKEWIEIVFRVDPDRGSGAAEWLIVALAGLATVVFVVLARGEWRNRPSGSLATEELF